MGSVVRILFSGVGECRVHEVIEMDCVPPEGANINFYDREGDGADQEWTVRTIVYLPKSKDSAGGKFYNVYAVVG